jgi:hypothetical protein
MESLINKIKQRQEILSEYFQHLTSQKNELIDSTGDYVSVIDKKRNHYMLIRLGWSETGYIHKVLLHIDINHETGNLWVQQNNTEILPDQDLAEKGILRSDFVLGFRPAWMRGLSGLAVA